MLIKLIICIIAGIFTNLGLVFGIILIFEDKIYIECHIEKTVLILLILILIISLFSYILSKVFDKSILNYLTTSSVIFFSSILSLNFFTVIKSLYNITQFQDKIYICKFFTLYYKYTKKELLYYLEKYYDEITQLDKRLSQVEKLKILGNAKTIEEVQANVQSYCNYELSAWWPKISSFFSNSIIFLSTNPSASITLLGTVAVGVLYLGYKWFISKYNMHQISTIETNDVVTELVSTKLSTSLTLINEELKVQCIIQNKLLGIISTLIGIETEFMIINSTSDEAIPLIEKLAKMSDEIKIIIAGTEILTKSENIDLPKETTTFTLYGREENQIEHVQ